MPRAALRVHDVCCRYKRAMGADCAVHIIKFLAAHNVTHVTDPFCGKGTVLAAANAFGISAQGVDLSSKQGELPVLRVAAGCFIA